MTHSAAATTLLIAASIIGQCADVAVAQGGNSTITPLVAGKSSENEPSLKQKLNTRIDLDVVEQPLKDVAHYLQDVTGIQFVLRQKKLEEASVSPDTPVTKTLKQVRLSTLLDLVLDDLELTYIEKDGLLIITTPEDAESNVETRVYDCRDLLALTMPRAAKQSSAARGGAIAEGQSNSSQSENQTKAMIPAAPESPFDAAPLIDLIYMTFQPDIWRDGNNQSIGAFNGMIVITQTGKTHEHVEHLLNLLRKAAGLDAAEGAKVVR